MSACYPIIDSQFNKGFRVELINLFKITTKLISFDEGAIPKKEARSIQSYTVDYIIYNGFTVSIRF